MNTIDLMKNHVSVRRFTDEAIAPDLLKQIIEAAQQASTWKNFQSYSIIHVTDPKKKQRLVELVPQEAILQSAVFLLFIGDLHRAEQWTTHQGSPFYGKGIENILISAVDTALIGQNVLLAAESLGYGGVVIGMVRHVSKELSALFQLPDHTYPLFGIALGRPSEKNQVKPRLPYESVVYENVYQDQSICQLQTYEQTLKEVALNRQEVSWGEKIVQQFGAPPHLASQENLLEKKLL